MAGIGSCDNEHQGGPVPADFLLTAVATGDSPALCVHCLIELAMGLASMIPDAAGPTIVESGAGDTMMPADMDAPRPKRAKRTTTVKDTGAAAGESTPPVHACEVRRDGCVGQPTELLEDPYSELPPEELGEQWICQACFMGRGGGA